MAAAHARQCVYKHDTCRDVPIARFQVGQNLYIGGSSGDNLGTSECNAAITSWYNEVQGMNTTYVQSFPFLGHLIPTIGTTFATTARLVIGSAFWFISKEQPDPPVPQSYAVTHGMWQAQVQVYPAYFQKHIFILNLPEQHLDAQSSVEPAVTRPAANLTAATNFCKIPSCGKKQPLHVYCLYPSPTWGKACKPAYPTKSTVTDADIVTILKLHNDYRRKVAQGLETQGNPGPQPPASNMRELKWDPELAAMAVTLTRQCIKGHDECRNLPQFTVGQNYFASGSSADTIGTSNWNAALASWTKEVLNIKTTYLTSFPENPLNPIGHYTQVVWADTYLVGCATSYFQNTAIYGTQFPYVRTYVCNYAISGNMLGAAVYKQGKAGSACPKGTKNNNGLCA
ncbi:hypothetical protein DAPPUDRAFT_312470 [Daphnia pulex]|uniref:SCP domain-containing protein n=1 Tax=Daphnia pulex TaxID=6669 RepID=E9G0Y4_DAPPU|nr:hypothetical protein DAPPUDRAFT_312470 [Daphnia pulex]|eukprot:EFX86985.1 hypothetical protein DAPPUDRAFT_312470 [Daphnia pulex]